MKSLRKVVSMLLVIPLAIAGLVGSPGVASAAVVVPPGGAGHTCSEYHWVTSELYWQTCAWADYQYVWFTVNFGNNRDVDWAPAIKVDYIKSGVDKPCIKGAWDPGDFVIPAHSVRGTPRLNCVITRVSAAYASRATVNGVEMHSPTLQVQ